MGAGVPALIGEISVTLYTFQRGGSRIVGVASTADATRIGRNGEVAENGLHRKVYLRTVRLA